MPDGICVKPTQPIDRLLGRLWRHISTRRRGQFALLFVLVIVTSFAEILSIGAVMPFLGALTAPARVFEHPAAQPFIRIFGIASADQLVLPLSIGFGLAALVAGMMRLLMLWANTRLSFTIGADLSMKIYHRTLYQPYAVHVSRNSSEIITTIWEKTNTATSIVMMCFNLVGSSIMLITIIAALFAIDPVIALTAFGGFGLIYGGIIGVTRKRLMINSQRVAQESTQVIKSLQEGLGGIRDVLIDGGQAVYCQTYRSADLPLRQAQGSNAFITASPRYAMEALGMMLITALAYSLAQQADGIAKTIPVLGALALGAQRLLPILQTIYASLSSILAGQASLQDALELLDQPLPDDADQPAAEPLPFTHQISLNRLAFRYSAQTPWIIENLSLNIARGSRVGFIGVTGSGKSTLLDILMGLLPPTQGELSIDGTVINLKNQRAWQAHIAHVPQAIFLADSSIEENIAFGQPKDCIDHARVRQAARQARIAEAIESWPEQYETRVGERGIRLSGGQRQRIGIARALYKQADVIIFDEATSALDHETEQAIMQAIESLSKDLTILIIAHRVTTLNNCTQIVELGERGILRSGSYQEIITQPA